MTRWTNGKLDLGALGFLGVGTFDAGAFWEWSYDDVTVIYTDGKPYPTSAAAKRAALAWLRRALKQAGKRVEVKR